MRGIFTLKSFNPVYAVWSVNTFCHFINSVVEIFYNQISFLAAAQGGDGDQYIYQDTISRWLLTKTEERFTCSWDGDYTLPGIKLVFHEISRVSRSLGYVSRLSCGCLVASNTDYVMTIVVGKTKILKKFKRPIDNLNLLKCTIYHDYWIFRRVYITCDIEHVILDHFFDPSIHEVIGQIKID